MSGVVGHVFEERGEEEERGAQSSRTIYHALAHNRTQEQRSLAARCGTGRGDCCS